MDFDFFTRAHFDAKNLVKKLEKIGKFKKDVLKSDKILGTFNSIKFSFFYLENPLIKKPQSFLGIKIASPADIGAMKMATIVDRGTKRDFIDLYFLVKDKYSLEKIFDFYNQKYGKFAENVYPILKSLNYFEDAEISPMPLMIKKTSWAEVKRFFGQETIRLAKKYL